MTQQSLDWFPVTHGEDRVCRVVLEVRVGGQHYGDWGDGRVSAIRVIDVISESWV
jgi:hypothetical protein